MNYSNKYNNEIGDVKISDELRNYYMKSFGVSNRKWRWYILFWDVVDVLKNACIIYMFIRFFSSLMTKIDINK